MSNLPGEQEILGAGPGRPAGKAQVDPAERTTDGLTYADVSEHNSKNDLYLVIHDKVYNASKFVDEHPGGEEVLLDVGGQDATEAFEDVGHSDEAREILTGLEVGDLKRQPGDPKPKVTARQTTSPSDSSSGSTGSGLGAGLYAIVVVGALAGYLAWKFVASGNEGGSEA
ncbi:MAG: hypothetical protein M1815_001813 [Lichina confinis]|nr:MAG: hypothetical protein M1815_001813 [Lichina confinis]